MLRSAGQISLGGGTMRFIDLAERRFTAHVVRRTNMRFDTRFAAPGVARGLVDVYMLRRGWLAADGPPTDGPAAWILDEVEFLLGASAPPHLRVGGALCELIDLQVPRELVRRPIGVRHGPVTLAPATWAAIDAVLALDEQPSEACAAATATLLDRLAADEVLDPALASTIVAQEPAHFRRLEAALGPLLHDYSASVSIDEVAAAAGVSARQVSRDIAEIAVTFGLIGDGFRDASLRLRLRMAVLLLSVPDVTATAVARHLGYSSLPAFATALRNAGLPSPQEIQSALRADVG